MSKSNTPTTRPPTPPPNPRSRLLSQLAAEIHAIGGHALLALAHEDYPVLYVRQRGRTVPVLVAQGPHDTWWFLWGRTSSVRADRVEAAARYLAIPPTPPPPPTAPVVPLPRRGGRRFVRAAAPLSASVQHAVRHDSRKVAA